mmetsp:Transcript_24054/g.75361  ORF Transcript_24054/g.75361 Transcript_24054/m.75361 type:complete len:251 (-) Transcript_24054:1342-2094(-)
MPDDASSFSYSDLYHCSMCSWLLSFPAPSWPTSDSAPGCSVEPPAPSASLLTPQAPSAFKSCVFLMGLSALCSMAAFRRAISSAVFMSRASSIFRWWPSYASTSSCSTRICSSRSLRRAVSAIMMSRCFRRSCLYLSTCALSSSTFWRSLSRSFSRLSYSPRIRLCSCWSRVRKAAVSSILWPPMRSWLCILEMRSSSISFSCFSLMNSRDLASSSVIAASLSSSARRFWSSSSKSRRLSTRFLLRWSSS